MSRMTLPSLLVVLLAGAAAACGATSSSGGASSPTATATPSTAAPTSPATPVTINASACPSNSEVGGALGVTLPAPTAVQAATSSLPSGATGIGCTYNGGISEIVEVVLGANVPTSYFAQQEKKLNGSAAGKVHFTSLSGVGDEAVSYSYSVGTKTDVGVIARKGSNLAGVFVLGPVVSLSQIESLINQLLG
jgi:hypothetical protein